MKLLKTNLDHIDDHSNNYLKLGDWYVDNDLKNKKINKFRLHPYHWDDRKKYYNDFKYLNLKYEEFINILKSELNKIHNINENLRYWKIIIGPWLRHFIDALYDRYEIINSLKNIEDTLEIEISEYNFLDFTPVNFDNFFFNFTEDNWNDYIFSELLKYQNFKFIKNKKNIKLRLIEEKKTFKYQIKNLIGILSSLIPNVLNRHVIISSYLTLPKLISLQLSLKQFPYVISPNIDFEKKNYNCTMRNKIFEDVELINNLGFTNFLQVMIRQQIPYAYIENFTKIKSDVLKVYPKNPKTIYTGVAYQADDLFKIWTAENTKGNCKLYIAQHGGNVGLSKWNQGENHQKDIADKYITWGWSEKNNTKVLPLPSPHLNNKVIKNRKCGNIILTLSNFPRYFYHHYSVPISGQYKKYIAQQVNLLNNIDKNKINFFRIRLQDASKFDWNVPEILSEAGFKENICNKKQSLKKNLKNQRLCVCTHNSTIFLETLASNFPTILVLDPNYNEIRDNAINSFYELKQVGIYYNSFQEAAYFINNNFENLQDWWYSAELQSVRKKFINNYAYTHSYWKKELVSLLTK